MKRTSGSPPEDEPTAKRTAQPEIMDTMKEQLTRMLHVMMSPDGAQRMAAEQQFQNIRAEQPDLLLQILLSMFQDPAADQMANMMSGLLIKNTLREATLLAPETLELVKAELLIALRTRDAERTATIAAQCVSTCCECVARVEGSLKKWPELLPFIFDVFSDESSKDVTKIGCLYLLEDLTDKQPCPFENLMPIAGLVAGALSPSASGSDNDGGEGGGGGGGDDRLKVKVVRVALSVLSNVAAAVESDGEKAQIQPHMATAVAAALGLVSSDSDPYDLDNLLDSIVSPFESLGALLADQVPATVSMLLEGWKAASRTGSAESPLADPPNTGFAFICPLVRIAVAVPGAIWTEDGSVTAELETILNCVIEFSKVELRQAPQVPYASGYELPHRPSPNFLHCTVLSGAVCAAMFSTFKSEEVTRHMVVKVKELFFEAKGDPYVRDAGALLAGSVAASDLAQYLHCSVSPSPQEDSETLGSVIYLVAQVAYELGSASRSVGDTGVAAWLGKRAASYLAVATAYGATAQTEECVEQALQVVATDIGVTGGGVVLGQDMGRRITSYFFLEVAYRGLWDDRGCGSSSSNSSVDGKGVKGSTSGGNKGKGARGGEGDSEEGGASDESAGARGGDSGGGSSSVPESVRAVAIKLLHDSVFPAVARDLKEGSKETQVAVLCFLESTAACVPAVAEFVVTGVVPLLAQLLTQWRQDFAAVQHAGIRVVIGLLDGQLSGDTSSVAVDCDTVLSLVRQCTILACENLEDDAVPALLATKIRLLTAALRWKGVELLPPGADLDAVREVCEDRLDCPTARATFTEPVEDWEFVPMDVDAFSGSAEHPAQEELYRAAIELGDEIDRIRGDGDGDGGE